MQYDILFKGKNDKKFKKVLKSPIIEWCSFIGSPDRESNGILKMVLQFLKGAIPLLFENKCPYVKRIDVVHMKIPRTISLILPPGMYQFKVSISFPIKPTPATAKLFLTFEIF